MNDTHPTYPNPTIQEALCEIHFRLPDGIKWNPTLFGEFFKQIQPDFPDLEPVTEVGVQLQFGSGGVGQAILPPRQRMRYKHASRNLLLQLSENILSVNVLPRYHGWSEMSRDILYAWGKAREVIKPASVTRIGLRYINRIEKANPDERAGDWLAASDYVPKAVLASLPGFLSRLEARPDPGSQIIVTVGGPPAANEGGSRSIILDIDCITESDIAVGDSSILEQVKRLHETAWMIFASTMTPRLEQLLKGEGK